MSYISQIIDVRKNTLIILDIEWINRYSNSRIQNTRLVISIPTTKTILEEVEDVRNQYDKIKITKCYQIENSSMKELIEFED